MSSKNKYIRKNEKYQNEPYLKVEILSECQSDYKQKLNTADNKCGEVFISNCGKMYFACSFCHLTFNKANLFKNHAYQHINLEEIGDSEGSISNQSTNPEGEEHSDSNANSSVVEDSEFESKTTANYIEYICDSLDEAIYGLDSDKSKNDNNSIIEPLTISTNMGHATTKTEETTDTDLCCDICNKKFRTKRGLDIHTARHETNASAILRKCSYCGKEFRSRSERVYHERTHTGDKPHICKVCGNTFQWNYQLMGHMRTHTGERPYSCPQCPVKFATKGHRNSHVRAHSGIKRHSCEVCNRSFVRKVEKTIHMRIHTGEKPFQCEICGSSFVASNKLYEHMKRHTNTKPYQCEICHKHFYSKDLLKNHQATHSDERPFECNICEASFPRKRALQCHMKIHSDVKEYVCNICGKAFSQNAGLYSHKKTHGHKLGNKTKEL